jgi:transcriptional regulator with XRE-family HTH domain
VSELSSVTPAIASDDQPDYTAPLLALMQAQGIASFKQLAQVSGWSEKALRRLRRGQVGQMAVGPIGTLAHTLNISTDTLIQTFSPNTAPTETVPRIEYERLQTQLAQQRQTLLAEFQQASLATLEPWLLQWSAAVYAAQQNPQARSPTPSNPRPSGSDRRPGPRPLRRIPPGRKVALSLQGEFGVS